MRRGIAPFRKVFVEDARGPGRLIFKLLVQRLVLHIGSQRRLDLHVRKDIAGAQGLLQTAEHGLGFFRVRLFTDLGRGLGHLGRFLRVGGLDVALGQPKTGLQRGHAPLNTGV